jgi:hypothetical protein
MTTKRIPIRPARRQIISDAALDAFEQMQALERKCRCPERDWDDWPGHIPNNNDHAHWESWYRECSACKTWSEQHKILHRALNLAPWQWPCIQSPDTVNPYPEGSYAAQRWAPDLEAQARYRELEQALAQRRKKGRRDQWP